MRLTPQEKREQRDREQFKRLLARRVKQFEKCLIGATRATRDTAGRVTVFYKNGAVFHCSGPVVDNSIKLVGLIVAINQGEKEK